MSFWNFRGILEKLIGYLTTMLNSGISEEYRRKNMKLLSTAYSTISVADASKFLGLTEVETVKCKASHRRFLA